MTERRTPCRRNHHSCNGCSPIRRHSSNQHQRSSPAGQYKQSASATLSGILRREGGEIGEWRTAERGPRREGWNIEKESQAATPIWSISLIQQTFSVLRNRQSGSLARTRETCFGNAGCGHSGCRTFPQRMPVTSPSRPSVGEVTASEPPIPTMHRCGGFCPCCVR